jgi:hypothetical protein
MTAGRQIGSPAIAALLGIAIVLLAASCAQSTSTAKQPTPSLAPSPAPVASPPPGGPVPTQLLGAWYLPAANMVAISGTPCPSRPTAANCFFQLLLTATTYSQALTAKPGLQGAGRGDVVVNKNELDFFNGAYCGLDLPDGVGRYTWKITGGLLHLSLISDPCPRYLVYTHGSWSRTP